MGISIEVKSNDMNHHSELLGTSLKAALNTVSEKCIQCGLCQEECAFLKKYGDPAEIAAAYDPCDPRLLKMPFECSLCGLCAAVCPVDITPAKMFLEMRRESDRRCEEFGADCVYLGYERRGTSRHLSYYALPTGCDTIFFPGCTFPATRPEETLKLYEMLREKIPHLGIVLDCCTKPSHDLGRQTYFHAMFTEMRDFLVHRGVRKVVVTCPNCYRIFSRYGDPIEAETIYEVVADSDIIPRESMRDAVVLHDPCVLRFEPRIQQSIRRMATRMGLSFEEMPHHGEHTLCCGEGGSVGCVTPELADRWKALRIKEAEGKKIVTYCAGCVIRLGADQPTMHILDLLINEQRPVSKVPHHSRFPLTCFNRLKLKHLLKQHVNAAVVRERTFHPEHLTLERSIRNRLAFLISLLISKLMLFRK